jgi:hypothetical protein
VGASDPTVADSGRGCFALQERFLDGWLAVKALLSSDGNRRSSGRDKAA